MIGTTFEELHDQLYYGCDVEMTDNMWFYMIYSAYLENGKHSISVWKFDSLGNDSKFSEELYNKVCENTEENINLFLNAKIFEGKSFMDIEQNIEIISM